MIPHARHTLLYEYLYYLSVRSNWIGGSSMSTSDVGIRGSPGLHEQLVAAWSSHVTPLIELHRRADRSSDIAAGASAGAVLSVAAAAYEPLAGLVLAGVSCVAALGAAAWSGHVVLPGTQNRLYKAEHDKAVLFKYDIGQAAKAAASGIDHFDRTKATAALHEALDLHEAHRDVLVAQTSGRAALGCECRRKASSRRHGLALAALASAGLIAHHAAVPGIAAAVIADPRVLVPPAACAGAAIVCLIAWSIVARAVHSLRARVESYLSAPETPKLEDTDPAREIERALNLAADDYYGTADCPLLAGRRRRPAPSPCPGGSPRGGG